MSPFHQGGMGKRRARKWMLLAPAAILGFFLMLAIADNWGSSWVYYRVMYLTLANLLFTFASFPIALGIAIRKRMICGEVRLLLGAFAASLISVFLAVSLMPFYD